MNYKIQITVDAHLSKAIKSRAKEMGLSVSSYARLALMSVIPNKNAKLLDQSIKDVKFNKVEALTLAAFKHQVDHL